MMAFGGRLDRIRQQLMEMECLTLVDGVKGRCHVFDVDRSKIVVSVGKSGLTGPELQERTWTVSSGGNITWRWRCAGRIM